MFSRLQPETVAPDALGDASSTRGSHAATASPSMQPDAAAAQLTVRRAVVQLETCVEIFRGANAPPVMIPAAGDPVSMLHAARLAAHVEAFHETRARLVAAHEALIKSLAFDTSSHTAT